MRENKNRIVMRDRRRNFLGCLLLWRVRGRLSGGFLGGRWGLRGDARRCQDKQAEKAIFDAHEIPSGAPEGQRPLEVRCEAAVATPPGIAARPGEIRLEARVVEIRTDGCGEAQGQLKRAAAQRRRGRNKRESA